MISPIAVYFERCEPDWMVSKSMTTNHILLLVTDGSFTYTVGGDKLELHRGDVLYVPEGLMRSARGGQRDPHHMYVAHFRLQENANDYSIPLLQDREYRYLQPFSGDYLKTRFSLLTQHWLRKPAYYETIYHSILLEMLSIVNGESDSRNVPTKSYSIAMQIQDYVLNHYRENITIAALSQNVRRTPNYISTIFRQVTGQTITEYTQQIRIAEACNMLINSQMTVGEISEYLGFCEQSYFNKVFKKVTGLPPSAYLREKTKMWRS
ncbi:MAG: AraC family transcriptional regulator [Paenibacillus sp.]|nr:AraC family transcriptional regulator [Paenibacillus sp.]